MPYAEWLATDVIWTCCVVLRSISSRIYMQFVALALMN